MEIKKINEGWATCNECFGWNKHPYNKYGVFIVKNEPFYKLKIGNQQPIVLTLCQSCLCNLIGRASVTTMNTEEE